jgi:hypothetical protein
MVKFKIEGQEYFLPDIMSIEHYVKIYKVKDLFKDDYFTAKLVSIVSNAPINDLLEGGFEEVSFLANSVAALMPTTESIKFEDRFTLDGIEYGIFPNWKDLTFAEYIDLDSISTKKPQDLLDNLHILAAIMYRPIVSEVSRHNYQIEQYDVDEMIKRAELFKKKLDVRYVLGAQSFFTTFAKMFLSFTPTSLTTTSVKLNWLQKIKLIWRMWRIYYKVVSPRPTVGLSPSTGLRKMILQSIVSSIK